MKEKEVQAIKEIERWLQESATLEACLVNKGIAVNDNMGVTESSGTESENSSSETLFSRSVDENRSFDKESSSSEGNHADVDIGSSNDSDSVLRSRVQTQSSNVSQNEAENLKSRLSEFMDKKFDNVLQKIESMKRKNFESQNSNDLLQKSLCASDPSNVESKSEEKKILFGNDTSSLETKIKKLEMTLAQQTNNFKDAKVDFSMKTDKFETYFEKLEKTKVVLERQLDRKIQDSNTEKDQFL
ncbi:hypothetical protein Tco_0619411 [Tanacetum coccineum]